MLKASQEIFQKMYFSGFRVESTIFFMVDKVAEWQDPSSGDKMFIVNPETHYRYLKFIEEFEKDKPLLAELH
jgi:hypothetical protein